MTCSPTHADCSTDVVMSEGMEGNEEVAKEESSVVLIYMFIAPQ